MLINKVLELKNIKGGNSTPSSGGGGDATLYFYSNDQYGGIYLFTPEVPADISKDTKCVSCESHGAYLAVTTIADNLYNSSSNVTYVDSTSFSYGGSTSFTRYPDKDITVSSSSSSGSTTPAGSDFLSAYKKYTGRAYCFWVCSSKEIAAASYSEDGIVWNEMNLSDSHCAAVSGSLSITKFSVTFTDGQTAELDTITDLSY